MEVADERPEAVASIIKAALRTRKRAAATIGDAGPCACIRMGLCYETRN